MTVTLYKAPKPTRILDLYDAKALLAETAPSPTPNGAYPEQH